MPIYNTPRLSSADVDLMNSLFRAEGLQANGGRISDYDILGDPVNSANPDPAASVGLAAYFGVTAGTVRRWLAPQGGTYRRMIPRRDFTNPQTGKFTAGAIGRRVYCMDKKREGFIPELTNLRQRIFLASALSVPGGFQRSPIYTGRESTISIGPLPVITDALKLIASVWTGQEGFFMERAWTKFEIVGNAGSWWYQCTYNRIDRTQTSQEVEDDEDFDGEEDPCGEPEEEEE